MSKIRTRNKHNKRRRNLAEKGSEYSNLVMKLFTQNSTGEQQDISNKIIDYLLCLVLILEGNVIGPLSSVALCMRY